jgi:23S rRNA (cytosine1962-C5)-methyltransferase
LHILNLFAYTGGSTLACSQAGAHLIHVDAAKGVVDWARKNTKQSKLEERPIRWLVDDAMKYVEREMRRNHTYHGIIFDPPSFGRGPKGEVFKIENDLMPLLEGCQALLAKDALFVLYSCHTPGFTPLTLENQLLGMLDGRDGALESGEMTLTAQAGRQLPSGTYARWVAEE